jgi:branched-chain amino acid transport system substrate-binding protein
VFRTIAPDTYEGEAMAKFAQDKGYQRVGVIFVDNAGTRGPAEVFRRSFEGGKRQVVAFEVVPQGSTDTRLQVSKVLGQRPDAVYLLGYALELGSMLKQVREQASTIPILSFQVMEEPKVREIAGAAAEGVIFTSPTIYSAFATGEAKSFIEKYRAKWREDPGIFAANAYDAVQVMAEAIDKGGFEIDGIKQGRQRHF